MAVATMAIAAILGATEWAFRTVPSIMLPRWELLRQHAQIDAYALSSVPDAEIGFLSRPNQRLRIRTDDFDYVLQTDHRGFPNAGVGVAAANLVILGDSLVEGEGVDLEFGFPALLSRRLKGARVVNLAVTAAGPERQHRIYRRFGHQLHPRLVIAAVYLASDLQNDEAFDRWLREGRGVDYELFRRNGGAGVPERDRKMTLRRWLQQESWLYGNLHERLRRALGHSRPPQETYRFSSGEEVLFDGKGLVFALNQGAGATPRVEAAIQSIERLRAAVEGDGARLIVMLIPSKEELFASGADSSGPPEVVEFRRRLTLAGLEVMDLYPVLRTAGNTAAPFFRRNIHLNRYGHDSIANAIAAYVESKLH